MTYLPKYKPEHPMYRESFHIEPTLQHTGELTRAHAGDAGLDLHSTIDFVLPGQSGMRYPKSIPTGVTVAIPRDTSASSPCAPASRRAASRW